jgi:imidazolonepropionase-like amidohydrolase
MKGALFFLIVLDVLISAAARGQDQPVAIVGATILTGTGQTLEKGTLVFRGGKIESVGAGAVAPEGAATIDGAGLFLTPGFIDAQSEFGIEGDNTDREKALSPGRDVLDRFRAENEPLWLRNGVTATYVFPGDRNLVAGYGAVVKLTGVVVKERAALTASFGEQALDSIDSFEVPTTRQGMVGLLRQTFFSAREDSLVGEGSESIGRVLAKEVPLHAVVNTPDDILTALRFGKEFGVRLVLVSAMGGHEVSAAIAEAEVPVIVYPSIIGIGDGGPYEGFTHTPANAARLHEAGVNVALATFARGGRSVALEGVVAKAHGLPREAALAAMTSKAAAILGVSDRLGTLETGKDADLVLWKGEPVSTWAETQRVIVDGETVFDRSNIN